LVFGNVELVWEVALLEFGEPKGFGKRREGHLEETEGIDETNGLAAFHSQEFTPVADLFHLLVVGVVLVHHEIPIVPLEIMGNDVDGTRLVQGQGIQPFEKLSDTLVSSEAKARVEGPLRLRQRSDWARAVLRVAWFQYHEEHVQEWEFFVLLLIIVSFLIDPQGLEASGSTPFGRRTSLTLASSFTFLFLFLDFLRGEGSLNVAAMGLSVDVLMTGRTIHVPAAGFGAMGLVTSISEKSRPQSWQRREALRPRG